ncbi:MAG: endo-alpha-N-acetylgalactosaminidase family protein [Armatimonadetes bacterium]|nr:endo-alpha-N-acetylgalactosaminidase family protein [Armatimonadota bacterium]
MAKALLGVVAVATAAATCWAGEGGFKPRLTSVSLSSDRVRAGGLVRCLYEVENAGAAPSGSEMMVYVHLTPAEPIPGAWQHGGDFSPTLPTYAWPGGSRIAEPPHDLTIPPTLPPGPYDLFAGLYYRATGARCPLSEALDGEGRTRLGRITVLPGASTEADHPVRWTITRATATRSAWELLSAADAGPVLTIAAGACRAALSAAGPRITSCTAGGTTLRNSGPRLPARVRIRRATDGAALSVVITDGAWTVRSSPVGVRYSADVRCGSEAAVKLDVAVRATTARVTVSIENVAEMPGYELLDVALPPLLGVGGDGWLAIPTQSGRLIRPASASPGQAQIRMDWFNMALCAAAGTGSAAAVVETRCWDSELRAIVAGEPGRRVGYVEPLLAHRAQAGPRAARVRLEEKPSLSVRLVADGDGDGRATWVDAAVALRKDLTGRPKAIYRDAMLYKIFCDAPGSTSYTTFAQALDVVRTVHRLAPWQKQVAYLVGWQYEGHDTGYPATDKVNARLGGLDEFRRCVAEAAKLNATLSVHDNFDDAYLNSPAYDEAVIARDEQGEPQKGGVWAGGQSYVLACGKYARKAGLERVRATVARLGVRESYHIDVLSAVPIRRDYNRVAPENTHDALAGKVSVVREFNRLGLDLTSEGFTAPFVGVIGHSWHLWHRRDTVIGGEESIPFVPFIYHGGPTTYGNGAQTDRYPQDSALWGAGFSCDWTKETDPHEIARAVYLVNVPWTLLRERRMQGWSRKGDLCRVTYDAASYVEADERTGAWRVVVDGVTVVHNDLVTLRQPRLLVAFSPTAREAEVELPADLAGRSLQATNLLTGAVTPLGAHPIGGKVSLNLPASEPIALEVGPVVRQ